MKYRSIGAACLAVALAAASPALARGGGHSGGGGGHGGGGFGGGGFHGSAPDYPLSDDSSDSGLFSQASIWLFPLISTEPRASNV